MNKLIILEGHRLTGKSTVSRVLRERINYATLLNPTGFKEDGERGLQKIVDYYDNWLYFLENLEKHKDLTFIFDRQIFSEMVYSRLYKQYDFAFYFQRILLAMLDVAHIDLFVLELNNDAELLRRAQRDKVPFAGIADSVEQVRAQREGYRRLFDDMVKGSHGDLSRMNMQLHTLKGNEDVLSIAEDILSARA